MVIDVVIFLLVHVSFLLSTGMFVVVVRKCRHSQIRTAFLVMLGVMTFWNAGTLLELDFRMVTGVTRIMFINLCYVGICLSPISTLCLGKVILNPDLILLIRFK